MKRGDKKTTAPATSSSTAVASASTSSSSDDTTTTVVDDGKVKVVVRCRPLNEQEQRSGNREAVHCEPARKEISLSIDDKLQDKLAAFTFDGVFDKTSSQQLIYENVASEIVQEALKGFNCTIFAYGQTGTGKTYTMEGLRDERKAGSPFWYGSRAGIIPRAVQHIFQYLMAHSSEYSVTVSYLELYNEDLIDLLATDDRQLKMCWNDDRKGVEIPGLEEIRVTSPEDIFHVLERSAHKRQTAATLLNKHSSRSHSIFTIIIQMREPTTDGEDLIRTGRLNLVDLAGSENVKRSGATGDRMKEAASINTSLLTLGRVITALTNSNTSYIPYRESKLTRLLQESLGGQAKTCIIATISASIDCLDETRATLLYAARAKNIRNKPIVNQNLTNKTLIRDYVAEIENLKNQLYSARSKDGFYVPNELWLEMQQSKQEQDRKLEDLEARHEQQSQELATVNRMYARKSEEAEVATSRFQQTKVELDETAEKLRLTTEQLQQTQERLQEQQALVAAHKASELRLTEQGNTLIKTLETTTGDIEQLHGKLARKSHVMDTNQQQVSNYQSHLAVRVEDATRELECFRLEHTMQYNELSLSLETFVKTHLEELARFSTNVTELKSVASSGLAALGELSSSVQRSVEGDLSEIAGSIEAANEQLLLQLQQRQAELEANASTMIERLASLNSKTVEWVEQVQQTLREQTAAVGQFSREQQNALEHLKHLTSEHVGEQQRNKQQQQRGVEAMAAENTARFSSMQQALVAQVQESMRRLHEQHLEWFAEQTRTLETNLAADVACAESFGTAVAEAADGARTLARTMTEQLESLGGKQHEQLARVSEHSCSGVDEAKELVRSQLAHEAQRASELAEQQLREGGTRREQLRAATERAGGFGEEHKRTIATTCGAIEAHYEQLQAAGQHANGTVQAAEQALAKRLEQVRQQLGDHTAASRQWTDEVAKQAHALVHELHADVATGRTPIKRSYDFVSRMPSMPDDEYVVAYAAKRRALGGDGDYPESEARLLLPDAHSLPTLLVDATAAGTSIPVAMSMPLLRSSVDGMDISAAPAAPVTDAAVADTTQPPTHHTSSTSNSSVGSSRAAASSRTAGAGLRTKAAAAPLNSSARHGGAAASSSRSAGQRGTASGSNSASSAGGVKRVGATVSRSSRAVLGERINQ